MHSGATELGVELLSVAFYGVVTSILAYGGVLSELSALQQYSAGAFGLALWYLCMGLVAFYAVVSVARERFWPALRRVAA